MATLEVDQQRIVARIVYDGPGRAGKTTNAEALCKVFSARRRSELFVPHAMGGRTLFFDWLYVDAGVVEGYPLRLQIVTVPGQIILDHRRAHIIGTADAVVFVCDSTQGRTQLVREKLDSLREHLSNRDVPFIVQANKQDLPQALSPKQLRDTLVLSPDVPIIGASASLGHGVLETLRTATKETIRYVREQVLEGGVESLVGSAGSGSELRDQLLALDEKRGHSWEIQPRDTRGTTDVQSAVPSRPDQTKVVQTDRSGETALRANTGNEAAASHNAATDSLQPDTTSRVSAEATATGPELAPKGPAPIRTLAAVRSVPVAPEPSQTASDTPEPTAKTAHFSQFDVEEADPDAPTITPRPTSTSTSSPTTRPDTETRHQVVMPSGASTPKTPADGPKPSTVLSSATAHKRVATHPSIEGGSMSVTDRTPVREATGREVPGLTPKHADSPNQPDLVADDDSSATHLRAVATDASDRPRPLADKLVAANKSPTTEPEPAATFASTPTGTAPKTEKSPSASTPPLATAEPEKATSTSTLAATEPEKAASTPTVAEPEPATRVSSTLAVVATEPEKAPTLAATKPEPATRESSTLAVAATEPEKAASTPTLAATKPEPATSTSTLAATEPEKAASTPTLAATEPEKATRASTSTGAANEPELATGPELAPTTETRRASPHTPPTQQPPLPSAAIPSSQLWPIPHGRDVLRELDIVPEHLDTRVSDGKCLIRTSNWTLHTSLSRRFVDVASARESLRRLARMKTQLGPLLPQESVLVIQQDTADQAWIWSIRPTLPTLSQYIKAAKEHADRPGVTDALKRYAEAVVDALSMVLRRGYPLRIDTEAFGVQDGQIVYIDDLDDRDVEVADLSGIASSLLREVDAHRNWAAAVSAYVNTLDHAIRKHLHAAEVERLDLVSQFSNARVNSTTADIARRRLLRAARSCT